MRALLSSRGVAAFSDSFLELLKTIDDSLFDPHQWPAVIAGMARIFPFSSGDPAPVFPSPETVKSLRHQLHPAAWTAEQEELFRFVCSHLEKGLLLRQQLQSALVGRDAALQALDRSGRGVLLVDESAWVLMSNAAARDILGQEDGLLLREEHLMATRASDNLLLRQAISAVAHHKSTGLALRLPRPSLRHLLALLITPASCRLESEGKNLALVFVSDPDRKLQVEPATLCRLYGLTRAEAHLACEILAGKSLEDAAQALSITANTARTHLKRVFLKTDTNRQAQLVLHLMNSA